MDLGCVCGRRLEPGPAYVPRCSCGELWWFSSPPDPPGLGSRFTPMTPDPDGRDLWWKREDLNPTGSFKDRGAAALAGVAEAWHAQRWVCDSSGSAALAAASRAARLNVPLNVHAPASLGSRRRSILSALGASVIAAGSREDAGARASEEAEHSFWFSHVYHPVFAWGVSVSGLEVLAQTQTQAMGGDVDWWVPVGNGSLLLGLDLALAAANATHVRLNAVQAAACPGLQGSASKGPTAAAGIGIADPPRREQILKAVDARGGTIRHVSEEAILEAKSELAARGIAVEGAAASVWAALRKENSFSRPAVAWLTGAAGRG